MADGVCNINDLFIFGDDFDAILAILESDEGIEEQFVPAVSEASMKVLTKIHVLALIAN